MLFNFTVDNQRQKYGNINKYLKEDCNPEEGIQSSRALEGEEEVDHPTVPHTTPQCLLCIAIYIKI